jgi:hypothetical protein
MTTFFGWVLRVKMIVNERFKKMWVMDRVQNLADVTDIYS